MQPLAPQIEKAVFQPRVLGVRLVAEHRQRQIARRAQNLDLADVDFNEAGRHVRVLGSGGAPPHEPIDPHHEFRAQLLGLTEGRRIRIDHALGQPVMVAEIDEQHPAVVADPVAPAGQANGLAGLGEAQGAAVVGAVAMHRRGLWDARSKEARCLAENVRRGKQENGRRGTSVCSRYKGGGVSLGGWYRREAARVVPSSPMPAWITP